MEETFSNDLENSTVLSPYYFNLFSEGAGLFLTKNYTGHVNILLFIVAPKFRSGQEIDSNNFHTTDKHAIGGIQKEISVQDNTSGNPKI